MRSLTATSLLGTNLVCANIVCANLVFGRIIAASFLFASLVSPAVSAERPLVETYLHEGKLLEGETALRARLQKQPADDEARFGLGMLQFIRAVERLGQSLHRLGTAPRNGALLEIPFLRLPVPPNPHPEEATYEGVRRIFIELLADLRRTELTLAEIKSADVRLPVRLGPIRLDLDGDGKPEDSFLAIVQNTSPCTYFGSLPINPCPEASFGAGLDLFALRRMRVPTALVAARRMLTSTSGGSARGGIISWHDQPFLGAYVCTCSRHQL